MKLPSVEEDSGSTRLREKRVCALSTRDGRHIFAQYKQEVQEKGQAVSWDLWHLFLIPLMSNTAAVSRIRNERAKRAVLEMSTL